MVNLVLTLSVVKSKFTGQALAWMWNCLGTGSGLNGRIMNEHTQIFLPDRDTNEQSFYEPISVDSFMVDSKTFNYFFLKRLIDLIAAIPAFLLLLPLMAGLALIIKIRDPGPALFRQKRIGLGGREFYCLKFRTMSVDATERLSQVLKDDPKAAEEWARDHKLKNDPRVTPFGRFLRRSSLDELPQIWNILKGEMSFVGPRPIVRDEVNKYGAQFIAYKSVPPGITGLWQISGRNDVDYDERVILDTKYAKSRNIWVDFGILLKTIPAILLSRGAY